MSGNPLFYGVFIAQIFLLSAYFPSRILRRLRYVLDHYPESTHAKLYPKSSHFYDRSMAFYKWFNVANFILGWVIIYFIFTGDLVADDGISPMLPWGYFMLQMVPSQLLEFFSLRLSKLMKQQDTRTTKTAALQPRGLLTYINPLLLTTVLLTYLVFVLFAFYLYDFQLDSKALSLSLILLMGYVFFFIVAFFLIKGKKSDPYQTHYDRTRALSLTFKTFGFVIIASSLFLGLIAFIDVYQFKSSLPVLMSLFLQLLVIISMGYMLQNNRLEDINFGVYRTE